MHFIIRNDTPRILTVQGAEGRRIVLAPLEQRRVKDLDGFDLTAANTDALVTSWEVPETDVAEKVLGAAIPLGIACAVAGATMSSAEHVMFGFKPDVWSSVVWTAACILFVLLLGVLIALWTKSVRLIVRFAAQALSLVAILAIGLGLPATTVYYFSDGDHVFVARSPQLFVRLLQVTFIATASLLPVLLYFLFDRFQLSTIRLRIYRDLFRLDHSLKTRSEVDARFGSQIREAYGPEDQGRGRIAPGTRWPVLVCAFVTTVGWLAVFRPIGSVDDKTLENPLSLASTAWAFAFLGAYFFGLQLIARRYARGDLKPKAYAYITVRMLTVTVLSLVLEAVFSGDSTAKLAIAFLVGIVPEEFFTLLREQSRGRFSERLVPQSEKDPLTQLDGIDLYDRARLEQEGIVNVESLAHTEFLHLVLETSMPVPRLVDWMDQAILYLHVARDGDDAYRRKLREYGIRTATDLLACWDAAKGRGELDAVKKLLGGDSQPYPLEVIRDALLDDEWLARVQDWRRNPDPEKQPVDADLQSFDSWLQWAISLEEQHRYRDAIAAFQKAISLGDGAQARLRLANLLATSPEASLRDFVKAREHAAVAMQLGQNDFDVLYQLIGVYERIGDPVAAVGVSEDLLARFGDTTLDSQKKLLKAVQGRQTSLKNRLSPAGLPTPRR